MFLYADTCLVSTGENERAADALGHSVRVHPQHPKSVLAMGSLLQDSLDIDGALLKYRTAADMHPDSPQVSTHPHAILQGQAQWL